MADGVDVTDTFVRKNGANFPIVDGNDIGGGGVVVQDLAARNALPSSILKIGMLIYVQDIGSSVGQRQVLTSLSPVIWIPSTSGGTVPDSGGPQADPGVEVFTVYVRSSGNDITGDGTSGNPYLTPERAGQTLIPLGATLKIDMTGYGTYTPAAYWQLPMRAGSTFFDPYYLDPNGPEYTDWGYYYRSDLEIYAAPVVNLTLAEGTFTQTFDSVTLQRSFTKTGAGWTVNQFQNKIVALKGVFIVARVVSNTSDTLVTTAVYGNQATVPGDLNILSPSCTIDLTTANYWITGDANGRSNMFSMTVAGINFTGGVFPFSDARFQNLVLIGCSGAFGSVRGVIMQSVGGHWLGEFCEIAANLSELASFFYDRIETPQVCANAFGKISFFGVYKTGGDSFGEGFYHQGVQLQPPGLVQVQFSVGSETGRGGLRILNNARGEVGFCRFDDCGYGAIRMEMSATCKVTGPLAGAGNGYNVGGMAVGVLDDCVLEFLTTDGLGNPIDATTITVDGSASQLVVGSSPGRSWASFFTQYPKQLQQDPPRGGARAFQRNADNDSSVVLPTFANAAALPTPSASFLLDGNLAIDLNTKVLAIFLAGYWYENGNPVAPIPVLTSFNVNHGVWGASIVVTGINLDTVTGIAIGSLAATFVVNSSTQLTFAVPYGSSTGDVQAFNGVGGSNTLNFTVDNVVTSDAYVDRIQARFDEHLSGLGLMWFVNEVSPESSFGDDDGEQLFKDNLATAAPIVPVSSHAALAQFPSGDPHGAGTASSAISDDYTSVDITLQYWVRKRTGSAVNALWPDFSQINARILLHSSNLDTDVVTVTDASGTEILRGTTVLLANTTYMITFACSGTGGSAVLKLYVNGVQEASIMGQRLNFNPGEQTLIAHQGAVTQYFSLEFGANDDATIAADYAAGIGP